MLPRWDGFEKLMLCFQNIHWIKTINLISIPVANSSGFASGETFQTFILFWNW